MPKQSVIISLDKERDIRKQCLEEIEFHSERLDKLEFRRQMLHEEIRQTRELLSILENEITKGGQ